MLTDESNRRPQPIATWLKCHLEKRVSSFLNDGHAERLLNCLQVLGFLLFSICGSSWKS